MKEMPQLRMRMELGDLPKTVTIPEGYALRRAAPEDASGIARVLTTAFKEPWSAEKVREVLLDHPEVPETFVIARQERIVAVANYQVMPVEFPNAGWLHYVAVDPDEGGRGLGYIVCLAVLEESARRSNREVYLTTDDFRVPAIRTYLKLGFKPDCWHPSHPERWKRVLA